MPEYHTKVVHVFEQMSTKSLRELLQRDLDAKEEEQLSVDTIRSIMEVLTNRELEEAETYNPNLEQARMCFVQDYLPLSKEILMGEEEEDSDELVLLTNTIHQEQNIAQPAKYRNAHFGRKLIKRISFVAVAAILSTMFIAQAFGINLMQIFATWTDETFHFETTDGAVIDEPFTLLLQEKGIESSFLPTWYPEGYVASKPNEQYNDIMRLFSCNYENETEYFQVCIIQYQDPKSIQNLIFEKDDATVVQYNHNDTIYYIMSNNNTKTVTWTKGYLVGSISGNLTEQQIYRMINSIGE